MYIKKIVASVNPILVHGQQMSLWRRLFLASSFWRWLKMCSGSLAKSKNRDTYI